MAFGKSRGFNEQALAGGVALFNAEKNKKQLPTVHVRIRGANMMSLDDRKYIARYLTRMGKALIKEGPQYARLYNAWLWPTKRAR